MPDSHRSNLTQRRFRLAQAGTVAGSLALGSLVVNRLFSYFREDFFLYYGISDTDYAEIQHVANGQLPITLGKLAFVAIALLVVCGFVVSERRRLAQASELNAVCRRSSRELVVERLSWSSTVDTMVVRTSSYAGLLLSIWLLQSSLERKLGGLGWGIEYADWRSLLPLASVFGLCALAGILVAAISMVGLRAIYVLELALRRFASRRLRPVSSRRPAFNVLDTARTLRELMGCDILSRPPPVAC